MPQVCWVKSTNPLGGLVFGVITEVQQGVSPLGRKERLRQAKPKLDEQIIRHVQPAT